MQVMPPRQKTKVNARRWRLGRFRLLMTGKGRTAIATSVRMLKLAFVNLGRCQLLRFDPDCAFRSYIPYDETVQTLPLGGGINVLDPEVADRSAREDCTENCPAGVSGDDGDQ